MEPKKRFDDLNDDCIMVIIEHLRRNNMDGVKAFSRTSRRYHQLAFPQIFDLKDLALRVYEHVGAHSETLAALRTTTFVAEHARALSVELWLCSEYDIKRKFDLPDNDALYPFNTLRNFLNGAPTIRELRLDCSSIPTDRTDVALRFGKADLPKRIRKWHPPYQFSNIRVLHVANVHNIAELIAGCPKLHTLCATYPFTKPKTTCSAIVVHRRLENVHLQQPRQWTSTQLYDVCKQLDTGVRRLCLSGDMSHSIDTADYFAALRHLRGVEILEVSADRIAVWEMSTGARNLFRAASTAFSKISFHKNSYETTATHCFTLADGDTTEIVHTDAEKPRGVYKPLSTRLALKDSS
ncbi:uncharacterized protein AB675_9024 [Cyphellophora attinorum]|uniref:F-box domain-containing protein n=1 Tax=Cyphellophora attinorum TaxID=1664694 RepID=A0A0N1P042_9EURO|nr:uncharacterized protein AB675_9024 [Phialophora attinorum]KPI41394.1 hypothetical protein AB675_9024 [Phialophora attinorum]